MDKFYKDKEILITGGTGTLGKSLLKRLLRFNVKGIRIYSRDEFKQWNLKNELPNDAPVSFLLGDVRDYHRLNRAMNGVDIVINTAAMKQVPACEYNPVEAIKTNIDGAKNILDACIDNNVNYCMHISTDKAVYPINLYGATKTVAEKLFIHGNIYGGKDGTKFSCCRYGNVLGSRGSIIPLFEKQAKENNQITITDMSMTRFWIPIRAVVNFIINNLFCMQDKGGKIYIPKMYSAKVSDLAAVLHPKIFQIETGIRQGEKLHECMITKEEAERKEIFPHKFVIHQTKKIVNQTNEALTSRNNILFLQREELVKYIQMLRTNNDI